MMRIPTALFHDRSLPRRTHVQVLLHGIARTVITGTLVHQLLAERLHGRLVVAALLNRRAVSLDTPLTSDCELVALTTEHWEGQRIYRRSLALLALTACSRVRPDVKLEVGPSIGFAQRLIVQGDSGSLEQFAASLEKTMHEMAAEKLVLREEWWALEEASEYFERTGSSSAVDLLRTWREPAVPLVACGNTYALRIEPLLPDTSALSGFRILAGDGVLLLVYGDEAAARPLPSTIMPAVRPEQPFPLEEETDAAFLAKQARKASKHAATMLARQELWLKTLGVTSVGAFNRTCIDGRVAELIRISEGFQEKLLGRVADDIAERASEVRVVCIAGPSSSGKTTFIRRLKVQLQVDGINPLGLSMDDYYVDREQSPRDPNGDYDFECLEALRVDLLEEHLQRLLGGAAVNTARYDFSTGRSEAEGGAEIRLGSRDVLMLEGNHGLNPRLLSHIPDAHIFRVFVCPLAQLAFDELSRVHASDVRLLRRIVRDRHSRNLDAAQTISRWPSVRAGERRHIFPFQHHADAVFDSSLIYELSVLKVFAERYLLEVPHEHPSYTTAIRLLALLDRFVAIYPDHVPPTSILREIIGGSGFEY